MTLANFLLEKEILIFGLKRSGLHALVTWIWKHFKHNSILYQNNSYLSTWDRGRKNASAFSFEDRYNPKKKIYINVTEHMRAAYIMQGIEYFHYINNRFLARKLQARKLAKEQYHILCIRDPRNNFASMLKKDKFKDVYINNFIQYWTEYADLLLENQVKHNNIFVERNMPKVKLIPFVFDKWFVDKNYRMQIADILNIKFTDAGLNDIKSIGSSFNGKEFQGKAQEMKVLDRWKEYKEFDSMVNVIQATEERWKRIQNV